MPTASVDDDDLLWRDRQILALCKDTRCKLFVCGDPGDCEIREWYKRVIVERIMFVYVEKGDDEMEEELYRD